jgi:hypothetical protein
MGELSNLRYASPKFYDRPPRPMASTFECVVAMHSLHISLPERMKEAREACRSVRYEGDYDWTCVCPLAA